MRSAPSSPPARTPAPSPAAPCRLPPKYRSHLHRLFVVHCDLPLWVALAAVAPACTEALWRKVRPGGRGAAGWAGGGARHQGAAEGLGSACAGLMVLGRGQGSGLLTPQPCASARKLHGGWVLGREECGSLGRGCARTRRGKWWLSGGISDRTLRRGPGTHMSRVCSGKGFDTNTA